MLYSLVTCKPSARDDQYSSLGPIHVHVSLWIPSSVRSCAFLVPGSVSCIFYRQLGRNSPVQFHKWCSYFSRKRNSTPRGLIQSCSRVLVVGVPGRSLWARNCICQCVCRGCECVGRDGLEARLAGLSLVQDIEAQCVALRSQRHFGICS